MVFNGRNYYFRGGWGVGHFTLVAEERVREHHYATYKAETEVLVPELARLVAELYVEPKLLRETLRRAADGLDDIIDMEVIDELVAQVQLAAIPEAGQRVEKPWLDMARNEVAEVLTYLVAEEVYDVLVVSKRVRNKEITNLPSRGVDMIGILSNPELRLVCGEVKASSAEASPPSVVDTGKDNLHDQLKSLIDNHQKILQELNWSHKHASEQNQILIGRTLLLWAQRRLPITVFAVLLRPETVCKVSDFGIFRERPEDFEPAVVRFCIARLTTTIEKLAEQVYSKAREQE
jgi:hypothetical protein